MAAKSAASLEASLCAAPTPKTAKRTPIERRRRAHGPVLREAWCEAPLIKCGLVECLAAKIPRWMECPLWHAHLSAHDAGYTPREGVRLVRKRRLGQIARLAHTPHDGRVERVLMEVDDVPCSGQRIG